MPKLSPWESLANQMCMRTLVFGFHLPWFFYSFSSQKDSSSSQRVFAASRAFIIFSDFSSAPLGANSEIAALLSVEP